MFNGILDAAFLQAACAHATPEPPAENEILIGIATKPSVKLPISISCVGEVSVEYVEDGETKTKTYTDVSEQELLGILPDDNTVLKITGVVTWIKSTGPGTSCLASYDLSKARSITEIDVLAGDDVTTLIMPTDDSAITTIHRLSFESLNVIKCKADNQIVVNSIAGAIGDCPANGVLYTNSTGQYYSTLETAATAKSWTIQPLS